MDQDHITPARQGKGNHSLKGGALVGGGRRYARLHKLTDHRPAVGGGVGPAGVELSIQAVAGYLFLPTDSGVNCTP